MGTLWMPIGLIITSEWIPQGLAMDALWVPLGRPILFFPNGPSPMDMEREESPAMDIERIEREGHPSPRKDMTPFPILPQWIFPVGDGQKV